MQRPGSLASLASSKQGISFRMQKSAVLLMSFTEKADADLIDFVEDRLAEGGLVIVSSETEDNVVVGLTTTESRLEQEAEAIHIFKMNQKTGIMDHFTVEERDAFELPDNELFTTNDWALLIWRILDDVSVLDEGQLSSNLSRKLDTLGINYRQELHVDLRLSINTLSKHPTLSLRHVLEHNGLCDVISSIHSHPDVENIWKETRPFRKVVPPVELIQSYYGDEVAFYFAWMGFLTQWLCVPAVFGVAAYCYRWYREQDINHDEFTPFYGLLVFIWGILFTIYFDRAEVSWSYKWGTLMGDYEKQHYFAIRPEFQGSVRKSPVTGELETHYPASYRRLKYTVSGLVSLAMLTVAFAVMILSLNLQGYINPKNDPTRWHEGAPHPFHFPKLSRLAEPGELFDASSSWRSLIPVVIHVACIFTLNNLYRIVATRLSEWENHRTQLDFRNSLILKRFLFEAFDCYIALLYLAFYERNVDKLRAELISVFNIDTFRRMLLECGLPWLIQKLFHRKRNKGNIPLSAEAELDEYEQFDDYMEIVITYGYVTLFASAYPLASVVAVLANLVEIRSDCFKLTYLCRRPRALRCDGLGMWKTLIKCITWLAALTNCLIFGYTSGQLQVYLPDFYYFDDSGQMRLQPGKGWLVIFIIFGLERLLIYTGLLLDVIIPNIPEDVMNELERKHWYMEQERKASVRESHKNSESKKVK